jgi:hypothetical protein
MSLWRYGPIGLVVGAVALMTVPDMVRDHEQKQNAAERETFISSFEKKLDVVEAAQKAEAASAAADRKPGLAVVSLRKSHSEVDGVDWYAPASATNGQDVFTAYVGDKGERPWLRVVLARTSGSNFLILSGVTLVASKVRATASGQLQTEAASDGRMLERIDFQADRDMVAALIAAADGGKGAIKLLGHNGNEERRLTEIELDDLKRVVDAYRELGGK